MQEAQQSQSLSTCTTNSNIRTPKNSLLLFFCAEVAPRSGRRTLVKNPAPPARSRVEDRVIGTARFFRRPIETWGQAPHIMGADCERREIRAAKLKKLGPHLQFWI